MVSYIQANIFNFAACAGCNNLPAGWNLPTENNLFSAGIFQIYDPVTGLTTGAVSQALFTQTISAITKFGLEVELHGDSSDNVGFDAFGIDQVPEPSYSCCVARCRCAQFLLQTPPGYKSLVSYGVFKTACLDFCRCKPFLFSAYFLAIHARKRPSGSTSSQ